MHPHFDFTTVQVIWTLTFAALLVLLVVLLGRERAPRFPWFTTGIALVTLRLLTSRLLFDRMAPIPLQTILITLAILTALVGVLVVVEMARRAFAGVNRSIWIVNAVAMTAVACAVLAMWGPWPAWKTLTADSRLAALRLMDLTAEKATLLGGLLTVQLGVAVVAFGRRFKAGWRSHTQQITIGLSADAISEMVVRGLWQLIAMTAKPHNLTEYQRVLALRDKLVDAKSVVYLAVLVWWIACLWIDEPGTEIPAAGAVGEEPAEIPNDAGAEESPAQPAEPPEESEKKDDR